MSIESKMKRAVRALDLLSDADRLFVGLYIVGKAATQEGVIVDSQRFGQPAGQGGVLTLSIKVDETTFREARRDHGTFGEAFIHALTRIMEEDKAALATRNQPQPE